MPTKEQLDRWRGLEIPFDGFYDAIAKDEPLKFLGIRFISISEDNSNYFINFEITTKGLSSNKAQLFVKEIDRVLSNTLVSSKALVLANSEKSYYELVLSKEVLNNLDSSFEYGGFEFKGFITCDGLSAETQEFKLIQNKKDDKAKVACRLQEPRAIKESGLGLNEKQKAQFISVVLGETHNGDKELWDIAWVYFNLVSDLSFEKGMKRSSFYKDKPETYKIFMYYLGQGDEYKDVKMKNGNKIKDWVETEYFINGLKKKIDLLKKFITDNMFINEPINPFPDWYGQGYWRDLNLTGEDDNFKWYLARTYYWLQQDCKVKVRLIKILEDGENTSFVFDENTIINFFKNNPDLLPKDKNKVKLFNYEQKD